VKNSINSLHFACVVDDAKCIVVTRVCVCLSAAACLHYCTAQDVSWGVVGDARDVRKSLALNLQSFTPSPKSSLKSLPTLSFLPCLGRSFTNCDASLRNFDPPYPHNVLWWRFWWTKLTQYHHLLFWKFRFLRVAYIIYYSLFNLTIWA